MDNNTKKIKYNIQENKGKIYFLDKNIYIIQ